MKQASFFEAAGADVKIRSSLQITNFNQVKLVQIHDMHHCRLGKLAKAYRKCARDYELLTLASFICLKLNSLPKIAHFCVLKMDPEKVTQLIQSVPRM